MNIVQTLIEDFSGQKNLADFLGVKPQAITPWVKTGRIPPGRAIEIERKTGGKYKATELCDSQAA